MSKFLVLTFLSFSLFSFAGEKNPDLEKKINSLYDKKAQIDLELSQTDENVKQLEIRLREKRRILLQRAQALNYIKNYNRI